MSRIARKPVTVPAGVKVAVNAASRTLSFDGPKGKLSFVYRPEVGVNVEGSTVTVTMDPAIVELGSNRAFWGTTRALIQTAVDGVLKGYEKKLEIIGVGWGARVQGKKLVLTIGFANTIEVPIPDGVKVEVNQLIKHFNHLPGERETSEPGRAHALLRDCAARLNNTDARDLSKSRETWAASKVSTAIRKTLADLPKLSDMIRKLNSSRISTEKKPSFTRAKRKRAQKTPIARTAPNRTTPIQPNWISRSSQPLCAEGTSQWVSARTTEAGTEVGVQNAL